MSTKNKKAVKESKFSRCIKAPIRVLTTTRDLYIKCMSGCASNASTYAGIGGAMGYATPQVATSLPKSFSVRSASSNDDDLAELMRAASTRSLGKKIELELLRQQQAPMGGVNRMPRSHTVAIGRIEEEKPCDFGEDIKLNVDAFPRSRSHAVTNTQTEGFSEKQPRR